MPDPATRPLPACVVEEKQRVRQAALARRDGLSAGERAAAAAAIAARGLPLTIPAPGIVAGFMPIRSEINPLPLMRALAVTGFALALPAIIGRGRPLAMRAWSPADELVRGQWGIREPAPSAPQVHPDIVLAPLAAFDRRGGRVGYGAGYYDMTLEALRGAGPVVVIGLAFAVQEVAEVPVESHDEWLDAILTERETIIAEAGALHGRDIRLRPPGEPDA